jgi:hypothetical protein
MECLVYILGAVVQEHETTAHQATQHHCFSHKQVAEHHGQVLGQQINDNRVEQVAEGRHVGEVAHEQVVYVALLQTVHREGEVVHKGEVIVFGPDQVEAIN